MVLWRQGLVVQIAQPRVIEIEMPTCQDETPRILLHIRILAATEHTRVKEALPERSQLTNMS